MLKKADREKFLKLSKQNRKDFRKAFSAPRKLSSIKGFILATATAGTYIAPEVIDLVAAVVRRTSSKLEKFFNEMKEKYDCEDVDWDSFIEMGLVKVYSPDLSPEESYEFYWELMFKDTDLEDTTKPGGRFYNWLDKIENKIEEFSDRLRNLN